PTVLEFGMGRGRWDRTVFAVAALGTHCGASIARGGARGRGVVIPGGMLRGPISAAVLLGVISLGLGCNEKALQNDVGPDSGVHHSSANLTPEQAAKVLARVGDKTITLGDYVATL